MILRRIVDAFRRQDWFTVFVETMIVVLGVFLGLQVQQWAAEKDRRRLEASYTERLHKDVVQLQAVRHPTVEIRRRFFADMTTVTPLMFAGGDRAITDQECQGIAFSYVVSNPTDDLGTVIELQSSGGLSVFEDGRVSAVLQSFLLTRARARDSQASIAAGAKKLASEYPDLIQVVSPTVFAGYESTPGTYRCDVDGLRHDPGFLNDFETNRTLFGFHLRDNARVTDSLAELHRTLDDALEITHGEPTL